MADRKLIVLWDVVCYRFSSSRLLESPVRAIGSCKDGSCSRVFVLGGVGLSDAADFRRRPDQWPDFLLCPCIEAGNWIEGEASGQSKGRTLRTHTRKFSERFGGAGNVVRFCDVQGRLLATKVALVGRCLVGVHHDLASSRINLRGCEVIGRSQNAP